MDKLRFLMDDYKNAQITYNEKVMELNQCMKHCESIREILVKLDANLARAAKKLDDFIEKEYKHK